MILFNEKTKWHLPKIPKVYMEATSSILCMFTYVDDVIYIKTKLDNSKLCNCISS